jgi:hypothetical protein
MQKLNFSNYQFRFKNTENKISIFDEIRKKFVILTPEEWVRQHVIQFLIQEKGYPKHLIAVEKQLKINDLVKRFDILVYDSQAKPLVLVECKAPKITINQATFDQIAQYNMEVDATYLMLTNGLNHYYCLMDTQLEKYEFLSELPDFKRE